MKETLQTLEFDARSLSDLEALTEFERNSGHPLGASLHAALHISDGADDHSCEVELSREGGVIRVQTILPNLRPTIARAVGSLSEQMTPVEWGRALAAFPRADETICYSVEVGYVKDHDIPAAHFRAYTEQGLRAIRGAVRERLIRGDVPNGITILTELVDSLVEARGFLIAPPTHASRHQPGADLVIPGNLPPNIQNVLAQIQLDYIGLGILGRDFGEDAAYELAATSALAAWLASHPFRRSLAKRHLAERRLPSNTSQIASLTNTLEIFEEDLIGDTLKKFESASESFRAISVEFLRDLHTM